MKVCLDTNVLVAAFATRGLCEDLLRTVLAEHDLFVPSIVVEEIERVLVDKLGMSREKARAVADFLRAEGTVVDPREPAALPRRDAQDRWVLAAAIEGKVDVLVTGDSDLLELGEEAPVRIASPRQFWEGLR